jgi:hypothetical protein
VSQHHDKCAEVYNLRKETAFSRLPVSLGSTTPQVLEEKDSFVIEVEEEQ